MVSLSASDITYELDLETLSGLMSRISNEEQHLRNYMIRYDQVNNNTFRDLAQWIVSRNSDSVQGMLDRINTILNGNSFNVQPIWNSPILKFAHHLRVSDQAWISVKINHSFSDSTGPSRSCVSKTEIDATDAL